MPATTNGKLAIMELDQDWEPGLPLSPGGFGQDDRQQLLWGFPEVLWAEIDTASGGVCADAAVRPSVLATAGVRPRVEANAAVRPRVLATAGVHEC